jgi:thiol-disulfide isomerase/thioredoxin
MKKIALFLAALGGTLSLSFAQDAKQAAAPTDKKPVAYKLGSVVDEGLTLTDLDGKTLSFKELRGKVVFIHFWSTQCPFEEVADPKVAALEKGWKDNKDVVVLAINANSSEIGPNKPADGYAAVRTHMKEKGLTNRVFADHGNKAADLFQAASTPHCFVLDRKGAIVYAGGLDDDPKGDKGEATKQYVKDAVEAVLSGKEVPVKESKPYGCSIKRVKA